MTQPTPASVGHAPTLFACFLHFDLSFMLWVLMGALGVYIARDLGLTAAEKGVLVAVPLLSGALLRIPIGMLADRLGAKRIATGLLLSLFAPLALAFQLDAQRPSLLLVGALLGLGGASFAVALPLASRWYPADRQGLVMGIAAAGNSGTIVSNLVAPRIAEALGWRAVFGLALLPLMLISLAFMALAKESPGPRTCANPLRILGSPDLGWLSVFYSITFGGYVGLSSFLPLFLVDQYEISPLMAGNLTAGAALIGSCSRPVGGYLADKVGGAGLLFALFISISLAYGLAAQRPPLLVMLGVGAVVMLCLGLGNGAVFQIVPQRFPDRIGAATGVIGAVGGIGGFFLPSLLGSVKALTGSFGPAFAILSVLAFSAAVGLGTLILSRSAWKKSALGAASIMTRARNDSL